MWRAGLLVGLVLLEGTGCRKDDVAPVAPACTNAGDSILTQHHGLLDNDGNIFPVVRIGAKRWARTNLRSIHYANGDVIPYVPDIPVWTGLSTGAWTNYNNDALYDGQYGKIYSWYAMIDPRNVCPTGWHVPTDADWQALELVAGVPDSLLDHTGPRGGARNAGGRLKALGLWESPNLGATDSLGFSAYPGGFRNSSGTFGQEGEVAIWWTATGMMEGLSWVRAVTYNANGIARYYQSTQIGASVRCVED